MSKRHAKKARAQVTINALDAQEIALIMRLHYQTCIDKAYNMNTAGQSPEKAEQTRKAIRSWERQARKAWAFAQQFDDVHRSLAGYQQSTLVIYPLH